MKKVFEVLFFVALVLMLGFAGGYETENIDTEGFIIGELSAICLLLISYIGANDNEEK